MRLLLSIPYFAPAYAFGGSVTVAETVVEDFLRAGHQVTVATTDVLSEHERLPWDAPAQPLGAELVRFRNVSHRLAVNAAYGPLGMRRWLAANVARHDLLLLNDVYTSVSVLSARAATRRGIPFALQPLGTLSPAPERGRSLAKRAFLRLWGNRTLADATALIHSSEAERRDFLDAGARPERLLALPLPLDLPRLGGEPKSSRPTVAFVGRLHPIKRIDVLLRAMALARQQVPDVRLEIVGPGDRHARELERLAHTLELDEAVRFHGFVSIEEKLRILAGAHVSALLSASEGLPIAALEAMACGTPVVLSEGCHLPEVDDVAGIVVPGSAEEVAGALVALLGDDARRARLSTGAIAFAAEFRRELVMPRMIGAFERLAAGGTALDAQAPAA